MSRIGKNPVAIPSGVKISIADREITVEGPKGKLQWTHRPEISVEVDTDAKQILCKRDSDERQSRALHGLTRALIQNMVVGVTEGYEKRLEIHGVGYIGAIQNNVLQLRVVGAAWYALR